MAFGNKREEQKQLSLQISNLSDLNNYDKIRVLGSGGFAKVYLVRYRKDTASMDKMKCEQVVTKFYKIKKAGKVFTVWANKAAIFSYFD